MTATATELTAQELKAIFRRHAAAVAVVTLQGPAGPAGFTATSVISVSATPPHLAFSIPVLHHTRAWVRGRIIDRFPAGRSHLVVLHAPEHHQQHPEQEALLYEDRTCRRPGQVTPPQR